MKFLAVLIGSLALISGCGSPPVSAPELPAQHSSTTGVRGADHIGLTVTKLRETGRFFTEVLGFTLFREDPAYPALFLKNDDIVVTLWEAEEPATAIPFDRRKNVGLHHVAFAVDSFAALDSLFEKVAAFPGVEIEFSPELLGDGPTKHAMFREPSGNRVELIHRP